MMVGADPLAAARIAELVAAADWACAHANWGTVVAIADELAARLPPELAKAARAVVACGFRTAEDVERDVPVWGVLSARLHASLRNGTITSC